MENSGKKFSFADFFFSYEGTIGRLAYLGGTVALCLMFWCLGFLGGMFIHSDLGSSLFIVVFSGFALLTIVWLIISFILLFSKAMEKPDMSQRSVLLKYPLSFCIVSIVFFLSSYFIVIDAINSAVKRDLGEVKTSQRSADHDLFFAVDYIYRNVVEYKEFCRKQGYDMTHLPDAFSTKFAAEIEVLDREMSSHGGTLKSLLEYMRKDEGAEAEKEIAAEFEYVRKKLILQNVAKEEGMSAENLQWSEEYNDRMTMAEVCSYIDREGTDLLPMDSGPAKQKFYLVVKQLKQWQ